jgi:transcriptional regulator with XRE-family HTH domain
MTSGEKLAKELAARGMEKSELGKKLGVSYLTINRWTKDQGFTAAKQRRAAIALKLDPDYFERLEDDDGLRVREAHRRRVFAEFCETDIAKRLANDDPDVLSTLNATPFPAGRRPTVNAFIGMALVFTGQLAPEDALAAIKLNESVAATLASKTRKGSKKKPPKTP